jgi:glycosyltransferase involved in cell wall biosynthesis
MVPCDNESIRVLAICTQFRPLVGGYERAAERLSAALADAGMRVVVITERRDPAWPAVEHIDGYEVRRLSCSYRRHRHVITSLISFASFLLRHGREFDIWHLHNHGFHAALAVALGKVLRRPVALKLMSTGDDGIEATIGSGITSCILAYFLRRVNAGIAISDETRAEAIRFGVSAECIHLIPNGLNSREFCPASQEERYAARQKLGLACDRLALYVGRLSAEKNPLGLLDAWAAVNPEAREGALLALVGDGPQCDEVQRKAQARNLVGAVHMAGHCSDVAIWYRAADLYVIPSHHEGLSNSMVEALACGLPVISTRVSGSSILVESPIAGLLVDVGSVKNLARALESLLQNKSMRSQLGANARLKFDTHFSLESLTKKMIMLYKKLIDAPVRGTA